MAVSEAPDEDLVEPQLVAFRGPSVAVLVGFELDAPGDEVRAAVSLLVFPVERIYRVHERLVDLEYRVPNPAIVLPVVLQAQDVEDLVERERYPSILRDPPELLLRQRMHRHVDVPIEDVELTVFFGRTPPPHALAYAAIGLPVLLNVLPVAVLANAYPAAEEGRLLQVQLDVDDLRCFLLLLACKRPAYLSHP